MCRMRIPNGILKHWQFAGVADLARFKQPKRVFFVDDLPRNTMGKVQKNLLREKHKGLFGA